MPLFKHMDGTAAIEEAAKRNHILALEKSAENKVGLCSCRMWRTLASVLAFLYRTSPIPKALAQETEAHRRGHLLAEGNCVVQEKKLNKVEGQLTRTKVKFAKLLREADDVSSKQLAEMSAKNKVGRCS